MVGENKKVTFAEIIGKFLDKPFVVGGTDKNGYDCIGLIGRISQARGLDFPEKFGQWDVDNYFKLYREDPKKAIEVMFEFFDSFAKRVDINRIVAGDIIAVEQPEKGIKFPAIYTGNLHAITSFIQTGVSVFTLNEANICIDAWRVG